MQATKFYTPIALGEKQHLTPEGFLVIYDVPIARTGVQEYDVREFAGQNLHIEPGLNGLIRIVRPEKEVFRQESMASANGKAIINEHPRNGEDVTPENWQRFFLGVVMNPRRGSGEFKDCLTADFFVYDKQAVRLIRDKQKTEVSGGYTANFIQTAPGEGEQRNILFNHVALVMEGRCGSQCSIGDAVTQFQDCSRGGNVATKWKDALASVTGFLTGHPKEKEIKAVLDSVQVRDADEIATNNTSGGGPSEIHLHTGEGGGRSKYGDEALDKKFGEYDGKHTAHDNKLAAHDAAIDEMKKKLGMTEAQDSDEEKQILGSMQEEAPIGTGDAAVYRTRVRIGDSTAIQPLYQRMRSNVEILVPGMQVHQFNSAQPALQSYKAICDERRKVLRFAVHDSALRVMLDTLRGGVPVNVETMSCAQVRDTFNGLAVMRGQANNAITSNVGRIETGTRQYAGAIRTAADLNKANAEYYKRQYGGN